MKRVCLRRLVALLLLSLTVSAGPAIGQRNAPQPAVPIDFNIPAKPLARALDDYSAATGLMVMYDSMLADGRRSTMVRGALLPDVALHLLLEGTGLVEFNAGKAFGLEAAGVDQNGLPRSLDVSERGYLALVQRTIERGFCGRTETTPGEYRAALQFRIATSGEVLDPELLSSTGDGGRDRTIVELLGRLRMLRGPPSGMAQPISMIVSPKPPSQSGDCAPAGPSSGRP